MAASEEVAENSQINGKKPRNTFLDNFGKLTSNEQKIRLKSGSQIIRHLSKNSENDEELQYAIGRLVRGVGSGKVNSRIGFYTTLNVFLRTSNKFDINNILDVIHKELKTSGQNLKSENADVYTGLILVCGAVLHAGKFATLENEKRKTLLQHLVDASVKKTYLGLLAASLIVDALPKLTINVFSEDILPVLRPQLKKPLSDYTIDQLYLLLKCEEQFPTVVNSKFLGNLINTPKIISEGNVKHLINVLLDVNPLRQIAEHPIYPYIGKKLASVTYLPKILNQLDVNFENFTNVKHQVLAVLLRNIVINLEEHRHMPSVFGKNFLFETVRHFKATTIKQQDEIKVEVINLLNATAAWAKKPEVSSDIKVKVMEKLMFYPGIFIFEKITGNKVLQSITATLDVDGVKTLCDIYKGVMLAELTKQRDERTTENWLNLDRVYAAQLIVKLINHSAARTEHDWKVEQLQLLMEVALLRRPGIGVDLNKSLKDTFFSALDFKFGKLQDGISCLSKLVHSLNENMNNLRAPLDEEVQALWEKSFELINKIEGKSAKKQGHLTMVFHMLFLQMSLQLFNDSKLAGDSLNELFTCYAKRKSKDEEVNWIEVVVDLFLNLLSHNSHLLRSVINKVFPHLCKYLTPSAIHQILHILDPKSDANPLSENVDSDDDDDEDEENEDDDDESNEEDDDEDESMEEDDDYEETPNDKLRQAIQDVLLKTDNDDNESIDLDDMSDTEAEKLNTALGEAFKNHRPNLKKKSKKQSKDDEILTHFRVRAMDLIDIYLDSPEVSMINCLEIMLPLLQGLEFSIKDAHQKPLHDRIKSSLKKLSGLKTFASTDEVDENVLHTLLKSILDKGSKSTLIVQEMGDKIADCCMLIINCSSIVGVTKKISALLTEVLDTYFKKRDCLTPYVLFKMVLNSNWEKSVTLIAPLVSYVFDEEIRPFRRRQALELLKIFYLNNRLIAANKETFVKKLSKSENKLNNNVVEFLERKEYTSKEPFVSGVFLLLAAIKNCCHQTEVFDWAKIGELAREYRSGIALTNDGKTAFSKLCNALKISNVVKIKGKTIKLSLINREADKDDEDDEDKEKVEKKKGNKEAKKMKKEARNLRMQSLSEGLNDKFNFVQTDVDELNENELVEENGHEAMSEDEDEEKPEVVAKPIQNGVHKIKKRSTDSQSESPQKKKKKKQKTT
ncbi:myb-binding protein 1A [Atheta coriaria]|uniref:myb-binding protein 1A n=1 Tax=Dalotia coriaria TaxID=877792 RepID=UPI0031F39497